MKNERLFYKCDLCGNLFGGVENTGVSVICCGKPMTELKPNTTDAAQEKHLPVPKRNGEKLKVTVGSVPHPMTVEHHIRWIAIADTDRTTRIKLAETGLPEAEACFCYGSGNVTIYAYCNLHGLWAVDL